MCGLFVHINVLLNYPNSRVFLNSLALGQDSLCRYSNSLQAGRSEDRIPVGATFSAPVQTDPEGHPASCTVGTGSFPGLKRPGHGVDQPPLSSAEVKKE
jgi:hypothetical protein